MRTRVVTLATTLLDPVLYPADALAELYAVRWQVKTHFNELKTTLKMRKLKSKTEEGIRKELAAYCLVYNLVRAVMVKAVGQQGVSPDRISLIDAIRWLLTAEPGEPILRLVVTGSGNHMNPGNSTGATSFSIWNTIAAANPSLGGQILSSSPGNLTEALNASTPFVMTAGQLFDYGLIFANNGGLKDLGFTYTKAGALEASTGSIVYTGTGTPEPTTLSLLGLEAMGLMARRKKAL